MENGLYGFKDKYIKYNIQRSQVLTLKALIRHTCIHTVFKINFYSDVCVDTKCQGNKQESSR